MRQSIRREWHEYPHLAFDIDGTLLNSNLAHVWAWQDALEEENLFFPHFTLLSQMGLPGRQIVEKFAHVLPGRDARSRIARRAGELYASRYISCVEPFAGAHKLLGALKKRGKQLYALTSEAGVEAAATLERFKLKLHFDHVLTAEEMGAGKPTAEPFSRLRELIGTKAQLISIGDSPYDLKASEVAGVPFVYVGQGGLPREWFSWAHTRFLTLGELLASLPRLSARRR